MESKLCKRGAFLIAVSMLLSLFMACSPLPEEPAPSPNEAVLPIEITDQLGRVVKLDRIPQRIISLAPSNTEILFALGLADKVVAVTDYGDYPPEAKEKPSIGSFSTPDIEKLVALSPDLILAANIHEDEVIPALERFDLPVLALDPRTLNEVLEAITLVGEITGKEERASGLVAEMQNKIKAVTDKTDALPAMQRPRVFYIIWHDPLMTVSSTTRIHELIVKAGGINIAQDLIGGYPTMSLEAVIMANPQIIIAGSGHGTGEDLPLQFAITEPRLKGVDARINNRVYQINTDLIGRPGPRIVDGLEKFAEFIHPELFKETR